MKTACRTHSLTSDFSPAFSDLCYTEIVLRVSLPGSKTESILCP